MYKKHICWVAIVLFCCFLFTACTNNSNINNDSAEAPDSNEDRIDENMPDYANMEAELTIFSLNTNDDFERNFGQYLKAKFPNYKFTHISQRDGGMRPPELIAAGVKFDLYIATDMDINQRYIPLELTHDMTELAETHGVDLDKFDQRYIESVTFDGKLYALPLDDNRNIMYYNKEIFDRFSVPYPRDDMTWEEALDLHNEITRNDNGTQYIGLWTVLPQYIRANQYSLPFVDPSTNRASVNNADWYNVIDKVFYRFTQDAGIQDKAAEQWIGHADFNMNQVIAMYVYHSDWLTSGLGTLDTMDWDIAAMPTFADLPGVGPQPNANNIGITSVSANKDAAMQVVKYLTGEEYQTIMSRKGKITPLLSDDVRSQIGKDHPNPELNWDSIYQNELAPRYSPRTPHDDYVVEDGLERAAIRPLATGEVRDLSTALRLAEDAGTLSIEQNTLAELE